MYTYVTKDPLSNNWSVWTKKGPTVADMEILADATDLSDAVDIALKTRGSLVTVDLSYGS